MRLFSLDFLDPCVLKDPNSLVLGFHALLSEHFLSVDTVWI
jgi:hypothetical protein